MFGPGWAMLAAAAGRGNVGGGGGAEPVSILTSVTHSVSIQDHCPTSPNFTISYAASGDPGDVVRIYRVLNDGTSQKLYEGPLKASENRSFVYGRKLTVSEITLTVEETIRARVEVIRNGAMVDSGESEDSVHVVDFQQCPE